LTFWTYAYGVGDIAERFAKALARRARVGVQVRAVLDAFGARGIDKSLVEMMRDAGVEIRWFRPLTISRFWRNDKRTHRKLLIVDDRVAFTGGVGISENWEGDARNPNEWREAHFALHGPVVGGLASAFLDNWNECGSWTAARVIPEQRSGAQGDIAMQVVRSSSTVGWTETAALLRPLVALADSSIDITTALLRAR